MKKGSVESLQWRCRWGCKPNALQIRWTVDLDSPLACAMVRQLQWVAPSGVVFRGGLSVPALWCGKLADIPGLTVFGIRMQRNVNSGISERPRGVASGLGFLRADPWPHPSLRRAPTPSPWGPDRNPRRAYQRGSCAWPLHQPGNEGGLPARWERTGDGQLACGRQGYIAQVGNHSRETVNSGRPDRGIPV